MIKTFYFEDVYGHYDEDVFTSETFEFAKVDGVVFVPYIKEIHWGVFAIYLGVHSKTGIENVVIRKINIEQNGNVLLEYNIDKRIEFEQTDDLFYEGEVDGRPEYDNVILTEEQVEIVKGKKYDVIVNVELSKEDNFVTKDVRFVLVANTYRTLIMQ